MSVVPIFQDLQLSGLGVAPEHCSIRVSTLEEADVGERVEVELTANALCYINGRPVDHGQIIQLQKHDRVILGPCTHVFLLMDPLEQIIPHEAVGAAAASAPTYDQAVREVRFLGCAPELGIFSLLLTRAGLQVLLRQAEPPEDRERRICEKIVRRWRQPRWRRLFEEQLVAALRHTAEANEICSALEINASFVLRLASDLSESRLVSLQYEDLMPYNNLQIGVACAGLLFDL